MGTDSSATARVDRLRVMYAEQFRESFDTGEFLSDDFYAFQVLERAFQIGAKNRELHNLAVLMHAERKALMETGQRQALEALRASTQPASQPGPQGVAPATSSAADLAARSGPATVPTAFSPPAALRPRPVPGLTGMPRPERRSGKVRMSAQEITALSGLRRVYHKHFGESFDVEEFACNDLYAKICLLYTSPSPRDGLLSRMPSSA